MKTFPDESIDLTMFSPPYWGLRDYGVEGQIGLEDHPSKYITKMVEVCGQVKRVLKRTGSMYIVIGDTYYGGGTGQEITSHGKMVENSFLSAVSAKNMIPNKQLSSWLQPKQLLGIPWRVAIALQEDAWILRNDIIWSKPNHMPSSVKDRLTNAYEHIFHFVKSRKYYYDLDAIREKQSAVTMKRITQPNVMNQTDVYQGNFDGFGEESEKYGSPRARTQRKIDETAKLFIEKGSGGNVGLPAPEHPLGKNPSDVLLYDSKYKDSEYGQTLQAFIRENTIAKRRVLSREEAQKLFPNDPEKQQEYINYIHDHDMHELGKNPSDFWSITTKPFKGAHFAVYPEEICIRPIKSSCPEFVCDKCGKPRTRITNVVGRYTQQWGQRKSKPWFNDKREMPQKIIYESLKETVGWSDCSCGVGFHNGVVLDPMCGSGTTLVVAKKLGRKYVGIELNPAYIEIAQKRLSAVPEKLTPLLNQERRNHE